MHVHKPIHADSTRQFSTKRAWILWIYIWILTIVSAERADVENACAFLCQWHTNFLRDGDLREPCGALVDLDRYPLLLRALLEQRRRDIRKVFFFYDDAHLTRGSNEGKEATRTAAGMGKSRGQLYTHNTARGRERKVAGAQAPEISRSDAAERQRVVNIINGGTRPGVSTAVLEEHDVKIRRANPTKPRTRK